MEFDTPVNIKVFGIGNAGSSVVNRMAESGVKGVKYVAVDTDKQTLTVSKAAVKIYIGTGTIGAQSVESDLEMTCKSVEENCPQIRKALDGSHMVFIIAGMGGSTGTGVAPIVAAAAKDMDILAVGVVSKPFLSEGMSRMKQAERGIAELLACVDALVVIPSESTKRTANQEIMAHNTFEITDAMLMQAAQSISDLIMIPGLIGLDFSDVERILKNAGCAYMGVGFAAGENKAEDAAWMALSSPLMERAISDSERIIIHITLSASDGLDKAEAVINQVVDAAHPDALVLCGAAIDETSEDEIRVTIIAAHF